MEKAVFFDIDGTLLSSDRTLTTEVKQAIKLLQSKDIFIGLATGRGPHTIQPLLKDLNMTSYVCFNGQYIVHSNEIIAKYFLDAASLKRLSKKVNNQNQEIIFLDEVGLEIEQQSHDSRESLIKAHLDNKPVNFSGVYQAIIFAREGEDGYLNNFTDQFAFARWSKKALDVLPLGRSKVDGIKSLIKRLSIDIKNVYAFGDGLNDLEMLRDVGTGIAMGNAHESVKKQADFVTSHADADGIVKGLKEVGLLPKGLVQPSNKLVNSES